MVLTVDKMIADGVMNPLEVLHPGRNRKRSTKRTSEVKNKPGRKGGGADNGT
jgi:hypothetical protein